MSELTAVPEVGTLVPQRWSSWVQEIFHSRQPPPALGTVEFEKIEAKAREALKECPEAFTYVFASAGTSSTNRANTQAFEKWKIVPRMLVDTTHRSLQTTIFGVKIPCPVFVGPMGAQGLVHPEGELATARATRNLGVPMVLSTPSTRSMEEVARENGPNSLRWFQLYWPRTPEVTLSFLARAKANGFSTLVVTVDTWLNGWRAHDIQRAYAPAYHGYGAQNAMSDPVFMKRLGLEPMHYHPKFPYDPAALDRGNLEGDPISTRDTALGVAYLQETHSGLFRTWDELKFLQDNWDGPIILKGIQTVEDAEKAIEYGMDGIVVSNHGGRQIGGALPSIYALDNICKSPAVRAAQQSGKFTVFFDSGIRNGSDIIKALALGAQAVFVARPVMFGLAAGGQAGIEEVLKNILADLEVTMGLSGYKSISEFQGRGEAIVTKCDV